MSRHQKPPTSYVSDCFQRQHRRMGSYMWDDGSGGMCCSAQHHNGRPLSVALTEPFDPFEPQSTSFFDDIPYFESDFASLHRQHCHHRTRSSGRRYKRECCNVRYPTAHFDPYYFSSPPPPPRRPMSRVASREVLVEKIETVTIEEQQQPRPPPCMVSYVRVPSPPVRQLKIRSRPSSCYDLHHQSSDDRQQRRDNRWSKFVEEHHEEHHHEYYHEPPKMPDRIVPIMRDPPTPPRVIRYDATTSTADLYIPPPPSPPPKPVVRPATKDAGTTTAGLPRRPLKMTETQVIERYEKTENRKCDSTSSTEGTGISTTMMKRPLHRSYDDDDDFDEKQQERISKKAQRKDFMQRMHARNGTSWKPFNTVSMYTDADRRRDKNRVIVRPTAKPREVLVDTSGIYGYPGEFSEPSSPLNIENGATTNPRTTYFRLPEQL